jgi:hypothetical protein
MTRLPLAATAAACLFAAPAFAQNIELGLSNILFLDQTATEVTLGFVVGAEVDGPPPTLSDFTLGFELQPGPGSEDAFEIVSLTAPDPAPVDGVDFTNIVATATTITGDYVPLTPFVLNDLTPIGVIGIRYSFLDTGANAVLGFTSDTAFNTTGDPLVVSATDIVVPEPATLGLLAAVGLGLIRRR